MYFNENWYPAETDLYIAPGADPVAQMQKKHRNDQEMLYIATTCTFLQSFRQNTNRMLLFLRFRKVVASMVYIFHNLCRFLHLENRICPGRNVQIGFGVAALFVKIFR